MTVISLTGKKLESPKKIKDESPLEPSFKVFTIILNSDRCFTVFI